MPVQHAVITLPVIHALMSTVQVATIRHVYNVKLAIILLERAVNVSLKQYLSVTCTVYGRSHNKRFDNICRLLR